MNLLLDHCLPRRLKHAFPSHTVATVREVGWERLKNGKLLQEAGQRFDALLTVDQNIKHQQNLARLPVAILVIRAPDNRSPTLLLYVSAIHTALAQLQPRTLVEVSLPD